MQWIVLPTHNEAARIRATLERVIAFLHATSRADDWRIIVADNGSTDATRTIVRHVMRHEPRIELLELAETGKGNAVLRAWEWCLSGDIAGIDAMRSAGARSGASVDGLRERAPQRSPEVFNPSDCTSGRSASPQGSLAREAAESTPQRREAAAAGARSQGEGTARDPCDVYVFMDADLATDLRHLPELVDAVRNGADIAVGSRYAAGAQVTRSTFRQFVSRGYHGLLRLLFGLRVADAPCGCKAVSARIVRDVVPKVHDRHWFFDTELLVRAQLAGFRITEIPVTWSEPRRGSAVGKILRIIRADLPAMLRLWWEIRPSSCYTRRR